MTRRSRWRIATSAAIVATLLAPVALDRDSFPLSTYPMYSRTRSSVVSFVTATGVDADGERAPLSLAIIGASDDPLIVAGELRAAITAGRADIRCAEIAMRSNAAGRGDLVAIEVTTERRDAVDYLADQPNLVDRTVHARCAVPR